MLKNNAHQTLLLDPQNKQGRSVWRSGQRSLEHTDAAIKSCLWEDILGLDAETMTAGTHVQATPGMMQAAPQRTSRTGMRRAVIFLTEPLTTGLVTLHAADDRMPQSRPISNQNSLATGLTANLLAGKCRSK